MDQENTPSIDTSLAAHAFGELRAEISLLRRAIERLTDERTAQPDYAPSLEAIGKRLEDVCVWARRVSEQPALKLTPANLGHEIATAATTSREQDQDLLERAASLMAATGNRIDATIARSRSVVEQNRALVRNRIAFAVAGMALWAILPGTIARSLPVRWAVPERIAARMLGTDMWQAGQAMMAKADPERWEQMVGSPRRRRISKGPGGARHRSFKAEDQSRKPRSHKHIRDQPERRILGQCRRSRWPSPTTTFASTGHFLPNLTRCQTRASWAVCRLAACKWKWPKPMLTLAPLAVDGQISRLANQQWQLSGVWASFRPPSIQSREAPDTRLNDLR